MPGDAFQTVLPGEKLQIPAAAYNAFLDAARLARARQNEKDGEGDREFRQTGIIKVRNDSGDDRGRFEVPGIAGPLIEPAENLQEFQNRVALKGVLPQRSHRGRFVVLLEPLTNGSIGRAVISGVTVGKVVVQPGQRNCGCADVIEADASALQYVDDGAA